jgi:hypothetical protein
MYVQYVYVTAVCEMRTVTSIAIYAIGEVCCGAVLDHALDSDGGSLGLLKVSSVETLTLHRGTGLLPSLHTVVPFSRRLIKEKVFLPDALVVSRNAQPLAEQRESMHPFSVLTLGIFVAGYITARWDLVTRLYELAIFAWDYGVVVRELPQPSAQSNHVLTGTRLLFAQSRAAKAYAVLSLVFLVIFLPVERLATREANLVRPCFPACPARIPADQPCPASTVDGVRYIGQRAVETAGIFLRGRWMCRRCLSCQSMMG